MTRGTLQSVAIAVLLALFVAAHLNAQSFVAPTQTKDARDTELWSGLVIAQHDTTTDFNNEFWMAGVRFGRVLTATHGSGWYRGNLQWDLNVVPVFVVSNLQSAYGFEIDPLVWRWNFARPGRTATYFEMSGGLAFTNTRIPPGDTSKINFVGGIGYGWQFFRRDRHAIDLGVRGWHLSNAWTAPQNPSANGIQITIGYHWYGMRAQRSASSGNETQSASEGK